MSKLWEIGNELKPHAWMLGLIGTWIGIILIYWRRRRDWGSKSFLNQVNFSLNFVLDRRLYIRTLLETSAEEVWLNSFGVNKVVRAAARNRPEQPFVILKDPEDMDFVNRAVLNVLSERFAEVFIARSLNLPVTVAKFVFAVTYEVFPDMRTRKIRVMIVEAESLKRDFAAASETSKFLIEERRHSDRLEVLRAMSELYLGSKSHAVNVLGELELGLAK